MPNRNVTLADISTYGSQLTLDDVIINTRTSTHADGKGAVVITNAATQFPTTRMGAKIWLDGDALGTLYDFKFHNGDDGETSKWSTVSNLGNKLWFQIIPETQLNLVRNDSSNGGYTMLILDIQNVGINGCNDAYPGLRDYFEEENIFIPGRFGISISGGTDLTPLLAGHGLSIGTPDDGHFTVKGVEVKHHFAAIRYQGGNYTNVSGIDIENCLLHNAVDGEGLYLGATHGLPYALLRKINLKNVIVAHRAAEAFQFQHLIESGEGIGIVENFVIYGNNIAWKKEFQPGQDSCLQYSFNEADHKTRNGIIDVWGSNGVVNYGTTGSFPDPTKPAIIQNCLFNRGGGILKFINVSTTAGVVWDMRKLFVRGFTNIYYTDKGAPIEDYYVGNNNGTDKHRYKDIRYDGVGKTKFFQDTSGLEILKVTLDDSLPAPDYINPGFSEEEIVEQWFQYFGGYHFIPVETTRPTHWTTNHIAINCETGVEYAFYKCIEEHDSTSVRPRLSSKFVRLTWDAYTIRSDKAGHDSGTTQSDYPPYDLRLKANTFYNLKEIGLLNNKPNTMYSQYQWHRSNTIAGLNPKIIPGGFNESYIPTEDDRGKYLACKTRVKNDLGETSEWSWSSWILVT